jgi:hypothetical protein
MHEGRPRHTDGQASNIQKEEVIVTDRIDHSFTPRQWRQLKVIAEAYCALEAVITKAKQESIPLDDYRWVVNWSLSLAKKLWRALLETNYWVGGQDDAIRWALEQRELRNRLRRAQISD